MTVEMTVYEKESLLSSLVTVLRGLVLFFQWLVERNERPKVFGMLVVKMHCTVNEILLCCMILSIFQPVNKYWGKSLR